MSPFFRLILLFSLGYNERLVAIHAASTTWYFAEGSVGNSFQEHLTLFNPNTTAATVTTTYLFQNTSPRVFTHTVREGISVWDNKRDLAVKLLAACELVLANTLSLSVFG